jgi:hypothetical protein
MYLPGQKISDELAQLIIACINDERVYAELSKKMRIEIDNQRNKNSGYGKMQSYDSLVSGNVNMQAKMAASGYDVYGRTLMSSNYNATNQSTYKKMKNQIRYGRSPEHGYINRGQFSVV